MSDSAPQADRFVRAEPARWRELLVRVDEILATDWDPIGVGEADNTFDEYTGYVPRVASRALRAAPDEVIRLLIHIRTTQIGLPRNDAADERVGKRIHDLAQLCIKGTEWT